MRQWKPITAYPRSSASICGFPCIDPEAVIGVGIEQGQVVDHDPVDQSVGTQGGDGVPVFGYPGVYPDAQLPRPFPAVPVPQRLSKDGPN